MDLAQHNTAYHRPTFLQNGNDAARREAEEEHHQLLQQKHQQQQHQQHFTAPFHFGMESTPSPHVDGLPFSTLSANLFMQQPAMNRSGSGSRDEGQGDNEDVERGYQHDQELRRHLAQAESWQGDWSAVAPPLNCPTSAGMVPMAKSSLDLLSSTSSLQPSMTNDGRRKLDMNSQELAEVMTSTPQMIDPFSVKNGLPPMPMTAGGLLTSRNLEHYASIPFPEVYPAADSVPGPAHSFAAAPIIDTVQHLRAAAAPPIQCPPHSAPPTMHTYPASALAPPKAPQLNVFTFRPENSTGEVGWMIEQQFNRYQATPLLNGKVKFPTRPLMPGVLAKVHNDWLDEYPETMPDADRGVSRAGEDWLTSPPSTKRFPTPEVTFESQHVRTLWQELERRRILEVNDTAHLHRLRLEAMRMIKMETAHRASAGIHGLTQQELFDSIPDPPEEHVNHKARILWEQTKKSAIYAVGLLRQAEYCIAQGHLGFMPLNHNRGAQQQQQQQQQQHHQQQQQQAEASRSAPAQRPNMMAAFVPDVSPEINTPALRLRGNAKYQEPEAAT